MSAVLADPRHNAGPATEADALRERLSEDNAALLRRADDLAAAETRLPAIEDDDAAGKVSDYIKQVTACTKALDTARVGAKEPFLEGGRTVDGFFKKVTDPLAALKKRIEGKLSIYLREKADKERREREAEAARLAEEAKRKEAEAMKAADTVSADGDDVLDEAIAAADVAATAQKAAEAKPAELSRTRGDFGALASLRTEWAGEIIDRDALDLAALRQHIPLTALEQAVRAFVKAGGRVLPGAKIYEKQTAVVR